MAQKIIFLKPNDCLTLVLTELKNLTIENLEAMPRITNAVFKDVFRHLELSAFTLSSNRAIRNVRINKISF